MSRNSTLVRQWEVEFNDHRDNVKRVTVRAKKRKEARSKVSKEDYVKNIISVTEV